MDERKGAFVNLDLKDKFDFNLPVSGNINIDGTSNEPRSELDLYKTFDGRMGSVTPSMGYTTEETKYRDGMADVENKARTVRLGLDGSTTLGPVDLSGNVMGSRTMQDKTYTFPFATFTQGSSSTFSKLGAAAKMGAFDFEINKQKSSGMEPVYSGSIGMNFGNGGRISYSDSSTGEPRIDARYRMEF